MFPIYKFQFCPVGGRDRRGGPILTFPSQGEAVEYPPQDIQTCLAYLAGIPP